MYDWKRGSVLVRIIEGDQPRSQGSQLENGRRGKALGASLEGTKPRLTYTISNISISYLD